ncbi:MAG: GNAT family N-acetyltransferase [Phycisphaerae bacterium]|nr:GNAT family N-acetyltransferase [Phycisphaerae bacterium]MCZ2398342.1 GNAT family N-acetyltransferase [Phycisphaerae bacterium]
MPYGWEGEKTRLVPLDREKHFDNALRWMNDPDLTAWMLSGDYPLTRVGEEEFFARVSRPNAEDVVFAVETLDGRHIGLTGLHRIDHRHGTALTGSLIGLRELWGQGYGTDMIRARTHYATNVLGLRLLWSEVMVGNDRSLRALLRAGYREAGRIPGFYWKRGAYRDKIMLYLRRDDHAA